MQQAEEQAGSAITDSEQEDHVDHDAGIGVPSSSAAAAAAPSSYPTSSILFILAAKIEDAENELTALNRAKLQAVIRGSSSASAPAAGFNAKIFAIRKNLQAYDWNEQKK